MKKRNICLYFILVVLFSCIMMPHKVVEAENESDTYYPMNCSEQYEVSYINDDGSFKKVACYADFESANNKMKELGGDHVVRSKTGLSPTKIVSMVSGIAYSYPGRSNGVTMNIYEDPSDRTILTKRTYITNHYEMTYFETTILLKDGKFGMVHVAINGFEGYADLENTDLVPTKYIENGIALYLGGNNTYENEVPFKVVPRQNYYIAEQNGSYTDLKFVGHRAYPAANSLEPVTMTYRPGPAPSFMQLNTKYYSYNGVDFYSDPSFKNYVGTNYSYYQFLPLRSKTNITAAQMDSFLKSQNDYYDNSVLKNQGQVFIDAQNTYGVNALIVYAMACHESAFGTSGYAVNRNNLFGWNAFDADPNQASYFSSIKQAVEEHMGINLRGYIDITDGRFFSSSLGNKGSGLNVKYASDPYWSMKIAQYAYSIDKFANNYNGQLSDYNQYDLALINEFNIDVKAKADKNSETLYRTGYGGLYQKDFIVITLDEEASYTKIQSTNAIDENGDIKTHQTPITTGKVNPISTYDFDLSVAYVETKSLLPLNYTQIVAPTAPYKYAVNAFNWDNNTLKIEGYAYVPGVVVNEDNEAKIELEIYNDQKTYTYVLSHSVNNSDEIYFADQIDLSNLENGDYKFKIKTTYTRWDEVNYFEITNLNLPSSKQFNNKLYTFGLTSGKLILKVEDYAIEDLALLSSIESLEFTKDALKIKAIGAIEGIDFKNLEAIKHQIILRNIETDEEIVIDATTRDSNGFTINDGRDYKYVAYDVEIPLANLKEGTYTISLKITNDTITKEKTLHSTNKKYASLADQTDVMTYKLSTNELYGYRFELDIFKSSLNFKDIQKPSMRSSLIAFDTINLSDEGQLTIDFMAMMYYLDYNDQTAPQYHFYFLDENGVAKEANLERKACAVDYKTLLESKNDLSQVCYGASLDVKELAEGQYRLLVSIQNGEYYDIIELTNRSKRQLAAVTINEHKYYFKTSDIRYRVEMMVEKESD